MSKHNDANIVISAEDKTARAMRSAQSNLRNLASSAAVMEGPLGQVAGRINAIGAAMGRMNPAVLAGGIGLAGFSVILGKSVIAASNYEQQMLKLEGVIKATGRNSEITANEIDSFAVQLGESTLASASGVREAVAAMLSYRNISKETGFTIVKLAQDMTALFGGDLRSNVVKLARAINNPREGLQSLSRNVLSTSSAWREMVSELAESGNRTEAANMVIKEISASVGGAAEAQAGGLAGKADTLGEKWNRLLETIGKTGALNAAKSGIDSLTAVVQSGINAFSTDDAKKLYQEELAPNLSIAGMAGFRDEVVALGNDSDITVGRVQAFIDAIESKTGVNLRETAALRKVSDEVITYSQRLANLEDLLNKLKPGTETYEQILRNIAFTQRDLNKTIDEFAIPEMDLGVIDGSQLATIEKDVNTFISSITRKTQTVDEQMLQQFLSLSDKLTNAGELGNAKLTELNDAYAQFLKVRQSIQDKADAEKAAKEQAAIDRRLALIQRQNQSEEQNIFDKRDRDIAFINQNVQDEQDRADRITAVIQGAQQRQAEIRQRGMTFEQRLIESGWKGQTQIISNMTGAISNALMQGNEKQFKVGKKLAYASAVMDTAAAVAKANSAAPPPWNIALIATALATGAAQIATIRNTKYGGGGSVSAPGGGASIRQPNLALPNQSRVFQQQQGGGQQDQVVNVNFNINALDTQSGADVIAANRGMIIGVVQDAYNQRGANGGPVR